MSQAIPDFPATSRSHTRTRWWVVGVIFCALLVWAGIDLLVPHQTRLREFDAKEVARLETAMWRSYYDKEHLALFGQLAELLRKQYRLPLLRSHVVAFQAAKAAFVFKEGRGRSDYEKALPNLVKYYSAIRAVGDVAFDVDQVAKLELEWWIIHRERNQYARADLDRSLAELPAAIYQMPVEKFAEHARLRAEAMLIRDQKAEQGGVSEADWQRIDELLQASWQSLHQAVNP
ncbi:MAG TPA: hypothetical protein VFZ34_25105 [Blastocatellia bacterium]|nr:hypothetical protein [Blastocatellia bacterium]